jgi:protein-glutamine gamma-glutamyltransferase
LPELDPRIPRLAAQIAGSAPNNFDKAAALENYLRTRFGYTLQLPQTAVRDPLANFLFERKRGHCEYFASAMAVMLRTLGIPSRVVNGFRTDEFNDLTGNYAVRAKDAHSWVEAYFPGYGWQTFDPTPGGAAGTPHGWDRIGLYLDAASSFWREWVISYDASHQYVLGHEAIRGTRGTWEEIQSRVRGHYEAMLNWARRKQQRLERSPGGSGAVGAGVALALLLLFNARRIVRMVHEKRLQWRPEQSPEQAASLWYARMARILRRRGMAKLEAQTPREFLNSVQDERLHCRVATFTAAYEAARFGRSAEDARQLPELYEEVESATRSRG